MSQGVATKKTSNLWRLIPMSNIAISDLHPTDFNLLSDSESYMRELSDEELNALTGGFDSVAFLSGAFTGAFIGSVIGLLIDGLISLLD
jgi:hypothetical protein